MNVFWKVTLQGLNRSRTRTIVTVIGVILSAAMITAVAAFGVSLLHYMTNGAIQKYGDWHVAFLDVDASFVQERKLDGEAAKTVTLENIGYAALDGSQNPNKPYLFITGFSAEAFDTLPITLISGRLPENSGEILVPAHVAANGGVHMTVGDSLSLAVGNRMDGNRKLGQHDPYSTGDGAAVANESFVPQTEKTYTIVGICQRPAFEEFTAPGYTMITIADRGEPADNYSIFITLKNPRQVHTYASNKAGDHTFVLNDEVLRFMGLSEDTVFNALLYAVGGVLTAFIVIGSVFLIYNSFQISLNERTRQFGILSSVGATPKQLRNAVLFEGFCIGAMGVPIGIIVGLGSIGLVISVVAEKFGSILYSTVPFTLTVSLPVIAAVAVVSMVTILISAYIPARQAARMPVMESIRQTNQVKIEAKDVKTSQRAQQIYGLEGTLALKNFKRDKKRYRSIVLSLTLSVVLFVSASTFGTHLKQAAEKTVVSNDYDICFYTQDMEEGELFQLYDQLKEADGVSESSYQAIATYLCAVNARDFSESYREAAGYALTNDEIGLTMDLQFVEDSVYQNFIERLGLSPEEYTGPNAKLIAVAKAKQVSDAGTTRLIDLFAAHSLRLMITPEINNSSQTGQEKNVNITFVDTIPVDTLPKAPSQLKPYVFMAVAPYQQKVNFDSPGIDMEMGLIFQSDHPAQSVTEMETIIAGAGITSQYTLYNVYEMLEQNRNILFIVNLFAVVFVIMISLIATANVFNTISTNIKLRRRELAMLRSIGMSDGDLNKMMGFECVFYGLRTLLLGLPTAAVVSWLIYKSLMAGGANIVYVFPWGSMGISILAVFVVICISMLYAVSKIQKENIIEALRDDMT